MQRCILPLLIALSAIPAAGQAPGETALPNPSFETGKDTPEGWTPGGDEVKARWETSGRTGKRSVSVTGGKAESSVFWKTDAVRLKPDTRYRFSFWARAENAGNGSIVSGLNGLNHDFPFRPTWSRYEFVGRTPREMTDAYLRLGQWNASGIVSFDDVAIAPVVPVNRRTGMLELGSGESVAGDLYRFVAPFAVSNDSRPLVSSTAGFNTNRWVLSQGAEIVYRHSVGDHLQKSARIRAGIGYYSGGRLVVEALGDSGDWVPVGTRDTPGLLEAPLPAALFPAREVTIRLRAESSQGRTGDSNPGAFQINGYAYEATLQDTLPAPVSGGTYYVEETRRDPAVAVTLRTLGDLQPGGDNRARLSLAGSTRPSEATLTLTPDSGKPQVFTGKIAPGTVDIPYRMAKAGAYTAEVALTGPQGPIYTARTQVNVPLLHAADYGYRISSGANGDLWWAEAPYKISRDRPAPENVRKAVEIRAARGEYEPFQIVVRPRREIKGAMVRSGGLTGPKGARIAAGNVAISEVAYVPIAQPTDAIGVAAPWPDPLPPLRRPIDLAAGQNQPFWITVYVPEDARPGLYAGTVTLSAPGWSETIPVKLTVRSFALPSETHVQSAFGLSAGNVRQYHGAKTTEQTASLMDRYYRNFARHRISPYDPVYNAPIRVDWGLSNDWEGGKFVTERPYKGTRSLWIKDDSPTSAIGVASGKKIPVTPGGQYRLSLAARTAQPGQMYQVSLQTYDAAGNWLSGRNLDINRSGSTEWTPITVDISDHLKDPMRFVALSLRPVPWKEDGSGTGEAWFDEIKLAGPDGADLLQSGDFETPATADPSRVKVDFTDFDRAAERAFKEYRFTTFRLPLQGMGGGTFHERYTGRIGSFEAGTPEYEALFGAYVRQLQDHLEAKGWLDKAYIYWFDEPDPKDYDFVRQGMERIHRHAPKLVRMLTEQPEPALIGAVDLWCPIEDQFDPETAAPRMKAGERFWWYVCTGPKAPYVTLFIDHPAVELRTWLWQTWKYKIGGILVWESVYWNSPTAYPDSLQNPWTDPMSWTSGFGTPTGTRNPWGNGDGRFLYPPRRDPNAQKTLADEDPIDSIRWEMLREGIEDYEYLWLLRDSIARAKKAGAPASAIKAAEGLLNVPAVIATDSVTFSTDPLPLLQQRERIAAAIEALAAYR